MTREPALGIADVATRSGLSPDTLRWYEREGLLPPAPRTSGGRRQYDERAVRLVELVVRLRRTGMPVERMRRFVALLPLGAESYTERLALLTEHRERITSHMSQLRADLAELEAKTEHYRLLIAQGLDCTEPTDGAPGATDPIPLTGELR